MGRPCWLLLLAHCAVQLFWSGLMLMSHWSPWQEIPAYGVAHKKLDWLADQGLAEHALAAVVQWKYYEVQWQSQKLPRQTLPVNGQLEGLELEMQQLGPVLAKLQ